MKMKRSFGKRALSLAASAVMMFTMTPAGMMSAGADETPAASSLDRYADRPSNESVQLMNYNPSNGTAALFVQFNEDPNAVGAEVALHPLEFGLEYDETTHTYEIVNGKPKGVTIDSSKTYYADKQTFVKKGTEGAQGAPTDVVYEPKDGRVGVTLNVSNIPESAEGIAVNVKSVDKDGNETCSGNPAVVPLKSEAVMVEHTAPADPAPLEVTEMSYTVSTDTLSVTYTEESAKGYQDVELYQLTDDTSAALLKHFGTMNIKNVVYYLMGLMTVPLEGITPVDGTVTVKSELYRISDDTKPQNGDEITLSSQGGFSNGLDWILTEPTGPWKLPITYQDKYTYKPAKWKRTTAKKMSLKFKTGKASVNFEATDPEPNTASYMVYVNQQQALTDVLQQFTINNVVYNCLGIGQSQPEEFTKKDEDVTGSAVIKTFDNELPEAGTPVVIGLESVIKIDDNGKVKYEPTGVKDWFIVKIPEEGETSTAEPLKDPKTCEHEKEWLINDKQHKEICPKCDTVFTDWEDHSYSNKKNGEKHWKECKCGKTKDEKDHTLEWTYDASDHWQKCGGCDFTTEKESHTLEWKYDDENHWQECSARSCNFKTKSEAHTLEWKSDGTYHWQECTQAGCKYKTDKVKHDKLETKHNDEQHWDYCATCKYESEKTDHKTEWKYDKTYHWKECSCGYKDEESKGEHDDEIIVSKKANCVDDAVLNRVCKVCQRLSDDHSPHAGDPQEYFASEENHQTEWYSDDEEHWEYCPVCEQYITEPVGHNYIVTVEANADCTHDAKIKRYCPLCKHTHSSTKPMAGDPEEYFAHHEWLEIWDGNETEHWKTCPICGIQTEHKAHNLGNFSVAKAKTCTEDAVVTAVCSVCSAHVTLTRAQMGAVNREAYIASGHVTDGWTNVGPAVVTDESQGQHAKVCKVCGEAVETSGHSFGGEHYVKNGTCGEEVILESTCECGAVYRNTFIRTHEYRHDPEKDIPATCEAEGKRHMVCRFCDADMYEVIPRLSPSGHHEKGETMIPNPPTCTDSGGEFVYCKYCGQQIELNELPALGHDPVKKITSIKTSKESVPDKYGNDMNVMIAEVDYECSRCGKTWPDQVIKIFYSRRLDSSKIVEGRDATVTDMKNGVHVKGNFAKNEAVYFEKVILQRLNDAIEQKRKGYIKTEGSLIITFTDEFLADVEDGEHELMIVNEDEFSLFTLTFKDHLITGIEDYDLSDIEEATIEEIENEIAADKEAGYEVIETYGPVFEDKEDPSSSDDTSSKDDTDSKDDTSSIDDPIIPDDHGSGISPGTLAKRRFYRTDLAKTYKPDYHAVTDNGSTSTSTGSAAAASGGTSTVNTGGSTAIAATGGTNDNPSTGAGAATGIAMILSAAVLVIIRKNKK